MTRLHPSPRHRGSALLAVMWVIALLSALVATTMLFLREDVETIDTRRQIFRARLLAEQGLAIAAHPDVKQDDEMLLRHEVEPGVGWLVEMQGEDGKLNPNILLQRQDRDTWRGIFKVWGLRFDDGEKLLNALIDWTDEDMLVTMPGGAEKRDYNTPGLPFNRPFRSVDEMGLVRYMSEVERIYPNWRSWFSVYSTGVVDVNEASAEVLSALTHADPYMAQMFVQRRNGRDGIPHTKDDLPFQDVQSALRVLGVSASPTSLQYLGVQSGVTRIKSRGINGSFSRTLYAIINRATSPIQGAQAPSGMANILWLGEEDGREGPQNNAPLPTINQQRR